MIEALAQNLVGRKLSTRKEVQVGCALFGNLLLHNLNEFDVDSPNCFVQLAQSPLATRNKSLFIVGAQNRAL